jgi:hypothetical protein
LLSDVVKAGAAGAMVDGGLRSGVNGGALLATFGRSELSIKLVHVGRWKGGRLFLVVGCRFAHPGYLLCRRFIIRVESQYFIMQFEYSGATL